jgi:hypothetical protein
MSIDFREKGAKFIMDSIILIPELLLTQQAHKEIIKCNEFTVEYGLKLSEEDTKSLVETRSEALSKNGRIEFGGGIVNKIIVEFCDSPYISQYNYISTINELLEIFYYYKNETLDFISDDELIYIMKEFFDNSCQGSLELLQDRELYKVAHNIKYGVADYLNIFGNVEDEGDEDE